MAVGQVGMSVADFCGSTPDEFEAIARYYTKSQEEENRSSWERMRILATIIIQPHVKKNVSPHRLLPLPWDKKERSIQKQAAPQMSKDEQRQRFIRLRDKLG